MKCASSSLLVPSLNRTLLNFLIIFLVILYKHITHSLAITKCAAISTSLRYHSLSRAPQTRVLHSTSTSSISDKSSSSTKTSSLLVSSTNLLKNCVGAGVFSLNSRVLSLGVTEASASLSSGFPTVIALIYLMAAWATYNFYILGISILTFNFLLKTL